MFIDTFHDTMAEAMDEAARRRAEVSGKELITSIDDSPYGGFRVRSVPADLWLDFNISIGASAQSTNNKRMREIELL